MTDKHLFYLIGVPGSGKSTFTETLLKGRAPDSEQKKPFPIRFFGDVSMLGDARAGNPGTDSLELQAQPWVIDWLPRCPTPYVYGEGDRLANDKFFNAVRVAGWNLTVAYLAVPEWEAAARRFARGSNQNASWVKGRETKVLRLVERWVGAGWVLDGLSSPADIVARCPSHPVLEALRAG